MFALLPTVSLSCYSLFTCTDTSERHLVEGEDSAGNGGNSLDEMKSRLRKQAVRQAARDSVPQQQPLVLGGIGGGNVSS